MSQNRPYVTSSQTSSTDAQWMERCDQLAKEAEGRGEARVGAVVVRGGEIMAESSERVKALLDVTAHAELLAIREACRALQTLDLSECSIFTNAEPCWMCAFAIRETQLQRIVIGKPIADIGGASSRYPILTHPAIEGWGDPPEIVWFRNGEAARS